MEQRGPFLTADEFSRLTKAERILYLNRVTQELARRGEELREAKQRAEKRKDSPVK
jgi:hypothetical protein